MSKKKNTYFDKPEFKNILAKYEGMVQNHTSIYFDAEDLVDIADYYISINNEERAEKAIDYSLILHPTDTDSLIYKIRSLSYKGKKHDASQLMKLIEDPNEREVLFLKAELLLEENQYVEAETIYMELAESENESLEILMDIAFCYIDTNHLEYAEVWIEKIRSKGYNLDNSKKFRNLWCDFCLAFGFYEMGAEAFLKSLEEDPYSITHWNGLSQCYLSQMNLEKANEAIEFSLAIDEKNQESLEIKAFCLMMENNFEEAIAIYKHLLKTSVPSNKKYIYEKIGLSYTQCNKFEDALVYYQKWLKEYPQMTNYEKSEIYSHIASCYCNMKRPAEGLQYIDAVLDIDPFNNTAIIQKAVLHIQQGEEDISKQLFDKALSFCPEDERDMMLYSIACSCFFTKKYTQAIEWCKVIMHEYPIPNKKVIILTACSYIELNDKKNAYPYVIQALQLCKIDFDKDNQSIEMIESYIDRIKEEFKKLNTEDYF